MTRGGLRAVKPAISSNHSTPNSASYNDDESEIKKRRANILENRALRNAQLLSPSPLTSPRVIGGKSLAQAILTSPQQMGSAGRLLFSSPSRSGSNSNSATASPLLSKKPVKQDSNQPFASKEQMNKHFEEWIKIAADNKINANNTWNLALIDYFSELSLLRDGDSINFQKASCTLDGCVKIYTSRVDSVANETGKLLSGLADNENNSNTRKKHDDNSDNDDADEDGNEEGSSGKKASRRKKQGSTIEKSVSALNVKKLDLDFDVDPLFKKTSADFDEGGASSLLMYNLSLDDDGKLVFDASDIVTGTLENQPPYEFNDELLDISGLKERIFKFPESEFDASSLCPSLQGFDVDAASKTGKSNSKSNDPYDIQELMRKVSETQIALENELEDLVDTNLKYDAFGDAVNASSRIIHPQIQDNESDVAGDFQALDDYGLADDFLDEAQGETAVASKGSGSSTGIKMRPFYTEEDYVVSLVSNADGNNMFSYFDEKLSKNWAGPEHWKLRSFGGSAGLKKTDDASTANKASASSSKKKASFQLDFVNAPFVDPSVLFSSKGGTGQSATTSLVMSKATLQERLGNVHLLPEDVNFKSKDLLSFFTKPEWKLINEEAVISKRVTCPEDSSHIEGYDYVMSEDSVAEPLSRDHSEIDQQIILNPGQENTEGLFNQVTVPQEIGQVEDTFPANLDDMGGFDDDDFDGFPAEEAIPESQEAVYAKKLMGMEVAFDFGNSMIAEPKVSKPIKMNFARTAKKVDVKKLKDNIWKEIIDLTEVNAEDKSSEADPVQFTELVQGLSNVYSEDKLQDISVPFCFICLLHLANEQNLEIKNSNDFNELFVVQGN